MTITRTALKGPARPGGRLFDRFEREVSLAGLPPGPFSAVWHLPDGELPYIEGWLDPAGVAFNIGPGG